MVRPWRRRPRRAAGRVRAPARRIAASAGSRAASAPARGPRCRASATRAGRGVSVRWRRRYPGAPSGARVFRAAPPGSNRAAHPLADARLALGVGGGADRQPRLRLGGRRRRLRRLLSRPEEAALRAARATERVLLPRHLLHGAHPPSQALGLEVAPEDHARVLLLVELRRQNLLVLLVRPAERPIVDRERGAGHRWHEVHQILAQVLLGDCLGELRARVARRHQMRRRPPRQHRIGGRGQSNSRGAMLRFRPTVGTRRVYHEKLRRTAIRRPGHARDHQPQLPSLLDAAADRFTALTAAASRR